VASKIKFYIGDVRLWKAVALLCLV
jgi:hypothetical protein